MNRIKTKLASTYYRIRRRCNSVGYHDYKNYGAKGIQCLWVSISEFVKDMENSYIQHVKEFGEKDTTIDRINSKGNYCKENCRWATRKVQNNNLSKNRRFLFDGKMYTVSELSDICGINYETLYHRLCKSNWSLEKSMQTPINFKTPSAHK